MREVSSLQETQPGHERNEVKVYLCGPINGCTDDECKNWRETAKAVLRDTLDPMRRDYRGREDQCVREIVEGDKVDVDACGAILVNYDKPSVGTSMEVIYAWQHGRGLVSRVLAFLLGWLGIRRFHRKIIVVVAKRETKISPWLRYHSDHIVHTFSEAYELLK